MHRIPTVHPCCYLSFFLFCFFVATDKDVYKSCTQRHCTLQCLSRQHPSMPTCFRYSTIRYSSIQAWDKTTSGFGNKIEAILEFYFRFRFWRLYRNRHVILHLLAKFRSNRTISGRVITLHRFFKSTSGLKFSGAICLRRWKSICMPNFDEISQSTAEIKLLPVSENWRPPYWQSIFGFDFDVWIVIGMSFCIWLPNFIVIRRSSAELWRHIHFFKMAAAAILDLIWVMLDHPRSAVAGLSLLLKFGLDPIYSFGDIVIFTFCRFGWNLPIHAHCLRGFGA